MESLKNKFCYWTFIQILKLSIRTIPMKNGVNTTQISASKGLNPMRPSQTATSNTMEARREINGDSIQIVDPMICICIALISPIEDYR